jgi:hypothetical protein
MALRSFIEMQRVLCGKTKIAAINRFEQCVRAETWDETGKPWCCLQKNALDEAHGLKARSGWRRGHIRVVFQWR